MAHPKLAEILIILNSSLKNLYQDRLVKVILFGSQARGDASKDSDIDILIVLKESFNPTEELKRTSHTIAELCLEHNVLISRVFTTIDRLETEASPFFINVRREGILV